MKARTNIFQNGFYYHVFNRGTNKELIFHDDSDRERFINSIAKYGHNLISISSFCLMDNHYHLLLEQKQINGISTFMQRIGTSYTKYFNAKYARTDSLFGSRYQIVPIKNDVHLLHVSRYIHLNSIAQISKAYRATGMFTKEHVLAFLMLNKWTSYYLYFKSVKNSISEVFDPTCILRAFQNNQEYERFVLNWLFSKSDDQLEFSE